MTDDRSVLRAELDALRRRLAALDRASAQLHIGTWEYDVTSGLVLGSDEMRRMLGLDGGDAALTRDALLAVIHPQDRATVQAALGAVAEGTTAELAQLFRVLGSSGEVRWVEACAHVESEPGGPRRLIGHAIDRTHDRQTTDTLQTRALRYAALSEHALDGVFFADPSGRYVEANRAALEMLGFTRAELLELTVNDLVPAEDRETSPPRWQEVSAGAHIRRDRRLRRKDGTPVSVDLVANRLPDGTICAITRDITARQQVEAALRESEHTLRELVANLPLLFWVRDVASGALLYASPGWDHVLGRSIEIGGSFRQLAQAVHPDDLERVVTGSERALTSGFDEVVRLVDRGGTTSEYRLVAFPIRDEAGRPYRIVGFAENIAARLASERALLASEARYRSVVLAMSDGIIVYGRDGEVVAANPSTERMLGVSTDQLRGLTSLDPRWRTLREDGSPLPGHERPGAITFQTGEPQRDMIMSVQRPDGSRRWLSVNSHRIDAPGGDGPYSVVATLTDITERRAAEARLQASLREKETLLRELHHRVKNNLQIIVSLLRLQSRKLDDPRLAAMVTESQRRVWAMALVHQMLYQSDDLSRIPFARYARDLARWLRDSYRGGGDTHSEIALVVEAEDHTMAVETAVPCGLILSEILSNSFKHAYAGGAHGTIRVALELGADDRYRLSVSDDGAGLPPDFEARTQMSLGTQLVERLVEQLGGTLTRHSSARGTSYEIAFPRDRSERA